MVLLVPRQLRMTGMTGNVPYYGGRLSPRQAYAASHPAPPAPPPAAVAPSAAPSTAPSPAPSPAPSAEHRDPVAALDDLLESGVITEDEYHRLRERIGT